ncbi:S-adenosylmethionine-dependent methyltransferase-like protein [Lasiosphaeria miniovina]|uniref:Alpha N-terminal protein methyltransferase 1 n=1 Tax=Lasiosphaeria miniovina TaxID=1954250 RepID=A0AA40B4S6_9PEZI|nr:S-adenosylmethionine-dependent methyltransferase-like protein [Lasiosphaeria miniovina]KAK0727735.1 S-adenosylmethionine-dependent methyltransferase-like protein [Lasiosphaeria miniovina]
MAEQDPAPASASSATAAAADSLINRDDGIKYWESIDADNNGMLGGFAHISKIDLQGSRNFLAKLGIGQKAGLRKVASTLEGGAGIGRITQGLLVDISEHVDVVEPVAKFTARLEGAPGVRSIFKMGLEAWQPAAGTQYDLIWIQWCVGHLTDEQLVLFLRRCATALEPDAGLLVVKENISTYGADEFDEVDSSVTREDGSFRNIFKQAGLKLLRVELQKGFPRGGAGSLLPVRMYALRPET